MRSWILLTSAILVLLTAPRPASAALQYEFFFDQANYAVDPNDTVDVNLMLREIVIFPDVSQLGPRGPGIFSIGALITSQPGVEIISWLSNPDFDDNLNSLLDSSNLVLWPGNFFSLPDPTAIEIPAGSGIYEILVGTVTFRGVRPGSVSGLTAANPDPGVDYTVLNDATVLSDGTMLDDATVLDSLISPANASITVSGALAEVPEPSSLACLSLVTALVLGASGWRRRRRVHSV